MTDVEKIEQFFEKDGFARLAGVKILSVDNEKAVITAKITDEHRNACGAVQGGMLYTVADFAFAVLGNHLHPTTVTQVGQISYVKAAFTEEITATATEIVRAGHTTVSQVVITDDKGQIVCTATFNGFVKEVK